MFGLFRRNGRLRLAAAAVTDRGLSRGNNEDALYFSTVHGVFCVADGMGGGESGEVASAWVREEIARFAAEPFSGDLARRRELALAALNRANERIRSHAREQGFKMMGSTVVMMTFDPAHPGVADVAHEGDSRLYRVRKGALERLTRDHTIGDELGEACARARFAGSVDPASRRNPLAHVLTRAIGTEYTCRPEWRRIDVHAGDKLLLCSDGVHDMVEDGEIRRCLVGTRTPEKTLSALERRIVDAGALDNYTMVCCHVGRDGFW